MEYPTMDLKALRKSRMVTQADLATRMGVSQGVISRLERQEDLKLSTLERYVLALGGRLEIRAIWNDEEEAEKAKIPDPMVIRA